MHHAELVICVGRNEVILAVCMAAAGPAGLQRVASFFKEAGAGSQPDKPKDLGPLPYQGGLGCGWKRGAGHDLADCDSFLKIPV